MEAFNPTGKDLVLDENLKPVSEGEGSWKVVEPDEFDEMAEADEDGDTADEEDGEAGEEPSPEGEVAGASTEEEWDGDPNKLDPKLQRVHKEMVRGLNMKFQELARIRKEYEQKLEAGAAAPQKPVAPSAPPVVDTTDKASFEKSLNEYVQYHIAQALNTQIAPVASQTEAAIEALAKMEQERAWNAVVSDKDFSEDIEQHMRTIAANDPFWSNQPATADSMRALYNFAKRDLGLQKVKGEVETHKATAEKRAVPRAANTKRKATAAENYSKSLTEKQAIRAMFQEAARGGK